ncbi:VTT domain-containing protein [Alphaproteobacteria bacterium]|nr:VTT domain-containing protein [Alphaproteobacteria bacterium]
MKTLAVKRLLLTAILLAGLTLFFASGASEVISWGFLGKHYAVIKTFARDHIWLGYLAFFCSYVLAVAFSLPIATLLTLAGGAVLGWPAIILVVIAATTGAGLLFLAARNIFTDLLRQRAGAFFGKLENGFLQNSFFYLLALRLVPAAPFWAVNIVPALTRMPFRQFIGATFLGIIPGAVVYISVGRGFDHILAAGKTPDLGGLTSPTILMPLVGLGALSLLPILVRHWQAAKKPATKGRHDETG